MKEIKQIVARISGHRNRECYTILCYAVEAARHYQPQEPKMKVILADVVDMMEEKKELSTLSKALSRVAADIWEHGDHQELWKVFGRQTVDPPTPKELVFRLAEYVWRESGTPEQQIAYRRWQSAAGAGYGIIAKIQEPKYHVVTSPITKDLDTVERRVQRLNQEQTPVRVFEERYLLGNLLDLMKN